MTDQDESLRAAGGVLPMRLSAFERYMMMDDRDEHPMVFGIRLRFSGDLDETAFRAAAQEAALRHPLLIARVEGENPFRMRWVASPDPAVFVDVAGHERPMTFPDGRERLDLHRENGLRIWARHGAGSVQMHFQFQHACADGIGAYRLIEDVLALYDRRLRGDASGELRPLNPELLRQRTAFGMPLWRRALRLPQELWGVSIGAAIFFINRPVDLPAPEEPRLSEEAVEAVLEMPAFTLEPEEYKTYRSRARSAGATVNDVLLRDMLSGMHEWVLRYDPALRKRYLRIMIPTNLRGENDGDMPCANVVGMVFIDRRMHRYGTPQRLLSGIRMESKWFKFFRFGIAFPRTCEFLPRVTPGGYRVLVSSERCYATSALSNMGRVFYGHKLREVEGKIAAGNLVLEAVESAPPVRPNSSTSFTALSYNGRLTLVMNYDRRHFTADAAQELMDMIAAAIRQTIEQERL